MVPSSVSMSTPGLTMEEWRPIPGREPYEASSKGRVRNGRTLKVLSVWETRSNCKTYIKTNTSRRWRNQWVHRLVLAAFFGEQPSSIQACHLNGDGTDNRLSNLEWGSAKHNARQQDRNYAKCECSHGLDYHDPDYGDQCSVEGCGCGKFKRRRDQEE